jgi:hypothetical protein
VAGCRGTNASGASNAAGFFQIVASDEVGVSSVVIRDSGSAFVSAPFTAGDTVKITQAPGTTATETRPGPNNTASHLRLRGDAILRVTDTSGNTTSVMCQAPPRHK